MSEYLNHSTREEEIVSQVVKKIRELLNPSRIFLFGSRVKNNAEKGSDFDFAVDGNRPTIDLERKLLEEIEKISGLYKVDIVYLNEVDTVFKQIILTEGKVIFGDNNERGN